MNYKNILVLTTSSVEGVKVIRYFQPVSAHIVVGANAFRDLFASFTDIFGGRSESYQKVLSTMYKQAIEQLQHDVYRMGANCILGLKIDIDEISGGGKSMFMITAVGTPVITQSAVGADLSSRTSTSGVSKDALALLSRKNAYLKVVRSDEPITTDAWEFLVNNRVVEAYPDLLSRFKSVQSQTPVEFEMIQRFEKWLPAFINALPASERLAPLYEMIRQEDEINALRRLYELIRQGDLVDLKQVKSLLEDELFNNKKKGVAIVAFHKDYYSREDLEDLQVILQTLENTFTERGQRTSKKQLLGKDKEVWTCECGRSAINLGENCSFCGRDIFGFTTVEYPAVKAGAVVRHRISLLLESFQ